MIQVIIADDEPLARRQIVNALKEFEDIQVCAECTNGIETVQAIVDHKPDVVFLDIHMPEMDGMEVINTIGTDQMPFIIFVTAYNQYAIDAFEKHAFDYLLKPFSPKRFRDAVNRVLQFVEQQKDKPSSEQLVDVLRQIEPEKKTVKRLAIRSTSRIYFLQVNEIDWIESAGNYVDIHTGDQTHLIRETMANMEAKLNPEQFIRVHRTAIVNLDRVVDIQPDGYDFVVRLKNGKTMGMSRRYKDKLNDLIQELF